MSDSGSPLQERCRGRAAVCSRRRAGAPSQHASRLHATNGSCADSTPKHIALRAADAPEPGTQADSVHALEAVACHEAWKMRGPSLPDACCFCLQFGAAVHPSYIELATKSGFAAELRVMLHIFTQAQGQHLGAMQGSKLLLDAVHADQVECAEVSPGPSKLTASCSCNVPSMVGRWLACLCLAQRTAKMAASMPLHMPACMHPRPSIFANIVLARRLPCRPGAVGRRRRSQLCGA